MKSRILTLLNVRSSEAPLVTNLFWLQFFQGAGVAIFNTTAFALFLQHFDVLELPKVYLFSAVLLWITGWLYSKAEHALPVKILVPAIIGVVALSILGFRAFYSQDNSRWFLFFLFSWYYIIYLLTNLEFWGLAALQFDIRQSKRLFGMIGAGDIPAKLIGYSAVPVLVKFFSSENMLVFSALLILLSLFFYRKLLSNGLLETHVKHDHQPHAHSTQSATDIIKSFFGNRMIAFVALLSFIVVTCVTIISFSFYSEIKHEAYNDKDLASFIAVFYAGGRIFAIFIRILLTGRLTNILGTKGSLLISPAILFFFLLLIIVLPFTGFSQHAVLYIFGLLAIITEVLKTSLQDPVFLSLMQPLSQELRLKGHTVVKGVMDPFALAFSGVMLLTITRFSGKVDLYMLSYLLFTLLVVWVVLIYLVDKQYVLTLVSALHKRYSVGQDIDLHSESAIRVLQSKVSAGESGEAMYTLNLIEKHYAPHHRPLVLLALNHPDSMVQMQAIQLAERKKITEAVDKIDEWLKGKTHTAILPEAVKAKCMLHPDELQNFDEFLALNDPRLTQAAITGFISSGGIAAVVTAGQKLLQLIDSPNVLERKMAAQIIGDLAVSSFYKPLLGLMSDADPQVATAAIEAAGKVKNEKLVKPLLQLFLSNSYSRTALLALQDCGEIVLEDVETAIQSTEVPRQKKARLIQLCGHVGTVRAGHLLEKLVWNIPLLRHDIFRALHQCDYEVPDQHKEQHLRLIKEYLESATRMVFYIEYLDKDPLNRVLCDALHLEMLEIRDALLLLFSFAFDREKMMKAKNAFAIARKENVANALEIIEIELPKEIGLHFIKLYEPGDFADKVTTLSTYQTEALSYETIIDDVLHHTHHHYHRWTRAAAVYSTIFQQSPKKKYWLQVGAADNDLLISESATKILTETEN